MVNISDVGFDLMKERTKRGFSQKKIAQFCGVSIVTVQNWEQGITKQIKDEHYEKLKDLFKAEQE